MRTTIMSDGTHGALLDHLKKQRREADAAVRLTERNVANDWKGIPTQDRRRAEEALPHRRIQVSHLTDWIDALDAAKTH